MTEQKVSKRYAHALIEVASEGGLLDKAKEDLQTVSSCIKVSREFRNLLQNPVVSNVHKKKIIESIFADKIGELVLKFLILLTDKNRESLLQSIIMQFEIQYNTIKNRLPVDIISAVELPAELKAKIVTRLEEKTEKTILPNFSIDSGILGGVQVRIGFWLYDASLKTQLRQLKLKMVE